METNETKERISFESSVYNDDIFLYVPERNEFCENNMCMCIHVINKEKAEFIIAGLNKCITELNKK